MFTKLTDENIKKFGECVNDCLASYNSQGGANEFGFEVYPNSEEIIIMTAIIGAKITGFPVEAKVGVIEGVSFGMYSISRNDWTIPIDFKVDPLSLFNKVDFSGTVYTLKIEDIKKIKENDNFDNEIIFKTSDSNSVSVNPIILNDIFKFFNNFGNGELKVSKLNNILKVIFEYEKIKIEFLVSGKTIERKPFKRKGLSIIINL